MKNTFLGFAILFMSGACLAGEGFESLWKEFYQEATNQKFSEPPKIYQVDDSNSTLCFIYKEAVYFFKNGKIEKAIHSKMFNVDGINRITFKESEHGGAFLLWSNEKLIIQFGA